MSPVSRASILLRHGETSTVSRACILVSSIGYFIKYTTRRQISNRFFDGGLMMQDDSAMSVILFLPLSLSFSLSYFSVFESGHSWLEMSKCFLRAICVLGVLLREIVAITNRARAFQTILSFLQLRS